VVAGSAPERVLCAVVRAADGRVVEVRERPGAGAAAGGTRWCGCAGFGAGVLAGVAAGAVAGEAHCGELLAYLLRRGARAEALEFREIHLNLNTAEDALLASLVEARRRWRAAGGHPWLAAVEASVAALWGTAGGAAAVR
jgi:hypothetical protein